MVGQGFQVLIEEPVCISCMETDQSKAVGTDFVYGDQLASGFNTYAIAYIEHFFVYHFCLRNKFIQGLFLDCSVNLDQFITKIKYLHVLFNNLGFIAVFGQWFSLLRCLCFRVLRLHWRHAVL